MDIIGDLRHSVMVIHMLWQREHPDDWFDGLLRAAAQSVVRGREISIALRHAGLEEQDVLPGLVEKALKLQQEEVLDGADTLDVLGTLERLVQVAERTDWTDPALRRGSTAALIGLGTVLLAGMFFPPLLLFLVTLVLPSVLYVIGTARIRGPQGLSAQSKERVHRLLSENVRRTVNESLREQGREDPFHVMHAPALGEFSDRAELVETASADRITRQAESRAYGSLGIAGRRGVGKSTLLHAFCDQRFGRSGTPELRVLVSAPVKYDALEFLTHVFARLCEAIIAATAPDPPPSRSALALRIASVAALLGGTGLLTDHVVGSLPHEVLEAALLVFAMSAALLGAVVVLTAIWFRRNPLQTPVDPQDHRRLRMRSSALLALAFVMLMVGTIGAVLMIQRPFLPPPIELPPIGTPYAAGSLLISAALVMFLLNRRLELWSENRQRSSTPIADIARAYQRRIRYLQTLTAGFTADLTGSAPVRLGRSSSRQWAEYQPTLPQVIDEYRRFATLAADWWRHSNGGEGRIVIGIDEVDKIGGDESAQHFLNEIKAIFGTPNCMYLVTVSEDALARFEQRSTAVRDAFDTAFDDIVRVERLTFTETREMLTRRVAGLTDPLAALCYVLSGGLPRDCLRVARSLVEICREHSEQPMDTAAFTEILVRREISEIKSAKLRRLSLDHSDNNPCPEPTPGRAVELLLDPEWPPLTPDGLDQVHVDPFNSELFTEFRKRITFLRAVLQVFTARRARLVALLRDAPDAAEQLLSRLATARISALSNLPVGPDFLEDID
ncbi:hypothetical protein GCM10027440_05640 [Nocardiopsis coralliicola]